MSNSINPHNGFCPSTRIFHSIRPQFPLPNSNISVTHYIFSLLKPLLTTSSIHKTGLIDALSNQFVEYEEVVRRVECLGFALRQSIGLRKGDVAFVLLGNTIDVLVLNLALLMIGVVISPGNPLSKLKEIDQQLELCKPVIAFVTNLTTSKIVTSLKFGTLSIDSLEFKSMMMIRKDDCSGFEKCGEVEVLQSDAATLLYSSGTTGRVKGVVLTHRNYIASLAGVRTLKQDRVKAVVTCCTVPYFHIYGLLIMLRTVALGECLVSMERMNMKVLVRAIDRYKVTHLAAAPPLVVNLLEEVERGYNLSSIEVVFSGGAPLGEAVIKKFQRIFPNVQLAQAYGLTETTGGVTRTMGLNEFQIMGASGRLIPHSQAKIVNPETGEALPPMKVGEIWVRGPTVMKGYVGDEEATRGTLDSESWLKTGDLGYFDEDGFLFFTDRMKELIKYNAYQVAPAELEHILQSHQDILEAAVIPYPDEKAGQVPMAFIVKKFSSNINESEVKAYVADQVSPYKRVRRVSFVDSIPKNATGKVVRTELIKMALSTKRSKL